MESSDDEKETSQKRTHERGKRKSGRKRKRKELRKEKDNTNVSKQDENLSKNEYSTDENVPDFQTPANLSKKDEYSLQNDHAATLPRDRRSRSSSGKRTIRDLFRRSPVPRASRSLSADRQNNDEEEDLFHDASEEVFTSDRVTEVDKSVEDYTRYNPTLQPRNRLRHMTVLDAVKEKQARRSPGRTLTSLERQILNERQNGRSSSLPDISAAESGNENISDLRKGKKKKHRSKSADMPRRVRPTSQSVNAETTGSSERDLALETHFPSNDSDLHDKSQVQSQLSRLKDNFSSKAHVPLIDKHNFAENEGNRRESFNRFLELRSSLPPFSTSSPLNRSKTNINSSNEGACSEHARHRNEPNISNTKDTSVSEKPKSYIRCPSYDEVMREKRALENEKHNIPQCSKQLSSNNSTSSITGVPETISTEENCEHSTVIRSPEKRTINSNKDETKSEQSTFLSEGNGENLKEHKSRSRDRKDYISPRRFSGRSSSHEKKHTEKKISGSISERKPVEQLAKATPSTLEKVDKNKDTILGADKKTEGLFAEGAKSVQNSKTSSLATSYIPYEAKQENPKYSTKYKRSFSPRSKEDKTEKITKPQSDSVKCVSIGVQTDEKFDVHFSLHSKSIAVNTDINLSYDFSQVKLATKIPVIIESIQDSNNAIDIEQLQGVEMPRKLSNRSTISDKSADIGSDNEYKTPEASPVFARKCLSSASAEKDTGKNDMDIVEIAEDDAKKEENQDDKKGRRGSKSKGKLSIMSIVALKRRLMRQRKRKNETVVSRQDSEILPKKEGKESKHDNQEEDQDLKNKTEIFIENETNISLSKLAQMSETDIIDDSMEKEENIFPMKHISFEKGDEPITSDEPLEEEAILRDQQARQRMTSRRESRMIQKRKEVITCCKKFIAFLFSHIGLCSLMVAYSILGGFIFQALEAPFEENTRIKVKNVRGQVLNNIIELAFEVKLNKRDRQNLTDEVNGLLRNFQTEVYTATDLYGWNNDDENEQSELQWSFASALLFAITVMTTIGYGHVAPKTDYGRIVTIAYAVLGIPLTLLCLTNIGDLMATGFRMLYAKVCCGVCCVLFSPKRRRIPDPEKGLDHQDLVIQSEEKSPEVVHVPTSLCILLMTSYILLGTLLFSIWEGWDAITGTYFSFITLSTIGFGDVVPGTAMDQWASEEKLVLCAMYLVFGLSLIAMCFNLVQEDVKAKCRWLGAKIGIFDESQSGV